MYLCNVIDEIQLLCFCSIKLIDPSVRAKENVRFILTHLSKKVKLIILLKI